MSVLQMNSEISGWICHAAALAERTAERIRWVRRGGRRKKRFSLLFKAGEWVSGWFTESCNYPVEITHSVQCGVAASFIFLALWCARKTAPLSLTHNTKYIHTPAAAHFPSSAVAGWRRRARFGNLRAACRVPGFLVFVSSLLAFHLRKSQQQVQRLATFQVKSSILCGGWVASIKALFSA
jgi:hypothetical protein